MSMAQFWCRDTGGRFPECREPGGSGPKRGNMYGGGCFEPPYVVAQDCAFVHQQIKVDVAADNIAQLEAERQRATRAEQEATAAVAAARQAVQDVMSRSDRIVSTLQASHLVFKEKALAEANLFLQRAQADRGGASSIIQ